MVIEIIIVLLLLFFAYNEWYLKDHFAPWSYAIKSNPYYGSVYSWPAYSEKGGRYTENDLEKYINRWY